LKNNQSAIIFTEAVRSPIWVYMILGLFLGLNSAIASGVMIVGLISEPLFTGTQSYIFYFAFFSSAIVCFYALVFFTKVEVNLSKEYLNISKRNTSKNINIDSISHLEKVSYTTQHKGSKKFLALFCTNAVKISYNENDIENKIIFSTNDPEKMIKILENLGRNH